MANFRENAKATFSPSDFAAAYFRGYLSAGKELGFSESDLRHAWFTISNAQSTAFLATDSRVTHIFATLNAKLGISLDPRDLPPVPANPDPGKFTNLVLVLAKTTVGKLVKAQNITPYINLAKVRNADGIKTPKGDYWLWMQGGLLYKGKCVNDVTKLFAKNERGGTCKEGLFLYLYYPELINVCLMDFAGSRYVSGFVPYLYCWDGGLDLGADYPSYADHCYGSVSAGVVS